MPRMIIKRKRFAASNHAIEASVAGSLAASCALFREKDSAALAQVPFVAMVRAVDTPPLAHT